MESVELANSYDRQLSDALNYVGRIRVYTYQGEETQMPRAEKVKCLDKPRLVYVYRGGESMPSLESIINI
jgi:hypothetical protein